MKSVVKFLFLFNLFFMGSGIYSEEISKPAPRTYTKYYFDLSQVHLDEDDIFLSIENNMMSIQSIMKDDDGFHTYISNLEAMSPMGTWICPACSKKNSSINSKCAKCGWGY